jgi:hypothetical protein
LSEAKGGFPNMSVESLISRATHTSGRSLLAVSSVVLLTYWYKFPLEDLPLISLAKKPPEGMITLAVFGWLIYLVITHALNWYNDYLGYQASFVVAEIKESYAPTPRLTEDSKDPSDAWTEDKKTIEGFNRAQKFSLYAQHLIVPLIAGLLALGLLIWN